MARSHQVFPAPWFGLLLVLAPSNGLILPPSKPCGRGKGSPQHGPGMTGFNVQSQTHTSQSENVSCSAKSIYLQNVESPGFFPKEVHFVSDAGSLNRLQPEDTVFARWQGYNSSSIPTAVVIYKGNSDDLVLPQSVQGFL